MTSQTAADEDPLAIPTTRETNPLQPHAQALLEERATKERRKKGRTAKLNRPITWKFRLAVVASPLALVALFILLAFVVWAGEHWGIWSVIFGGFILLTALGQLLVSAGVVRDVIRSMKTGESQADPNGPSPLIYAVVELLGGLAVLGLTWVLHDNISWHKALYWYGLIMLALALAAGICFCIQGFRISRRRKSFGWVVILALLVLLCTLLILGWSLGTAGSSDDSASPPAASASKDKQATAAPDTIPNASGHTATKLPDGEVVEASSPNFSVQYVHTCGQTAFTVNITNTTGKPHRYTVREGGDTSDPHRLGGGKSTMFAIARAGYDTTFLLVKDADTDKTVFSIERPNC